MNFPNVHVEGPIVLHASQCAIADSEYQSYASPDAIVVIKDAIATATKTAHSRVSKWYSPGAMIDISTATNEPNALKQMWRTHPSSSIAWDVTNLWPEGSMAIPFTPGHCACEYSFVNANAPIWGQCIKVNLIPNATDHTNGIRNLMATSVTITKDRWYVFSMDVKTEGEDGYLAVYDRLDRMPNRLISVLGHRTNPAVYGYPMWATQDQWRRYVTVRQASVSGTLDELRLYNPYMTDPNYYIANIQMVEFDTAQSAYEYVQRNAVAPGWWMPRTYMDDEPGTSPCVTIVAATDNGKIFSNADSGEACQWNLPAATPGQRYTFVRMASFDMYIDPCGTEYFRPHGGAGAYLQLDTDGDSATIQCFTAGVWEIVAGYGTHVFEP